MAFMDFERHCWAEIDLGALRHNFSCIKSTVGGPICAVVKADAYGHGDVVVARVLQQQGAAAFAVSCLSEGKHLRRHGITRPILVLGYVDPRMAPVLASENITTACFSAEYAQALSAAAAAAGVTVKVHLKIDTGMGRIGFAVRSDFETALREIRAVYMLPNLEVCGVFQHFAVADSNTPANIAYTDDQYALFQKTIAALMSAGLNTGTVHCANSAAQMRHPDWRCDMTRAGIILYGLDPSDEVRFPMLEHVMSLKAVITQIKTVLPGQSVSYGRAFVARVPTQVATVCVGYGDGYPRSLSGNLRQGMMSVNGRPAPVLGRVCMDQTAIDVTHVLGVRVGDTVTVFGTRGCDTAESIARKTGTISYEIVCGITRRVPRVYVENGKPCGIRSDLEER